MAGLSRDGAVKGQIAIGIGSRQGDGPVTKVFVFLLLLVMVVHIIKPIGLPGLKSRGDFWKIALVAIVIMAVAVLLQF